MAFVIYEKPTCTTCRKVNQILAEEGIDYRKVNYYIEPLTAEKLKKLIAKSGKKAVDFVRSTETIYKELSLKDQSLDDDAWVELFVKYPDLLQRPIAENNGKVVLARPAERIREIV